MDRAHATGRWISMPRGGLYRRHALPVRIMHWINVVAVTVLFMSGLNIFDAYPQLDWGRASYTAPPVLEITAEHAMDGRILGVTRIFGHAFDTTGWLGRAPGPDGSVETRAFPSWMTIPDHRWLAMARSWHLFFAWVLALNGAAYLLYALLSRHLANDLLPARREWREIPRAITDHLRLRPSRGDAARRYNVLQKLAYLAVIGGLLPFTILTGLAMSPWMNGIWPGWVDLLGGRQSARTLHFACAWLIVAFTLVHVAMVIVSGPWNHLRSMITGNYRVRSEDDPSG